ncbi:3D domain-containing protein [Rubrivivax sp. A210]|uniref:3D domain-containing protein n=1 Tax=Rubrivivax sp. A210 TaxID=2772301 RepID=UPI001919345F|nr:3D domain-containing protein [Rubrivivax sp. A210]
MAIGSATVSEDGSSITSDLGAGVIKAGWHCGGNPNTTGSAGHCKQCQKCQGASCVADPATERTACTAEPGKCGVCSGGNCRSQAPTLTVTRSSLTRTDATGAPLPGATPAYSYSAVVLSGSNTAQYTTADANATPNVGTLSAPANPAAGPSPGGLAELKVEFRCQAGETASKTFNAATFGLSCYILADEGDHLDATGACTSIRIGGTTFSGTTTDPAGLPAGNYCTAFLADVRLQGSGTTRNGTRIRWVSGSSPNWSFATIVNFTGADNRPLIPFGSCARDRAIVPRNTTVSAGPYVLEANDTGGAIIGYRLDVFGGTGRAACANFANQIALGVCAPGVATCPALAIP